MKLSDLPISFETEKEARESLNRLKKAIAEHNANDIEAFLIGKTLHYRRKINKIYENKKCIECKFSKKNEVWQKNKYCGGGYGVMTCIINKIGAGHFPNQINYCSQYEPK